MNNTKVIDYTDTYSNLIPAEIKKNINLYKDLLSKLDVVQDKLEKNFYRVTDIEKLHEYVKAGRLRVAKYSIIEEHGGGYKLVSFSDFFSPEFSEIRKLLEKLEAKSLNPEFKEYIQLLILAYTNNNFISPYKKWVQLGSKLDYDFLYFPTEPYLDKQFETILSFDAVLNIKDPNVLNRDGANIEEMARQTILNVPYFSQLHSSVTEDNFSIRVDCTLLSAAATNTFNFIGQNLPNEREFVKLWGTKSIIYRTQIDRQINEEYTDLYKKYFNDQSLTLDNLSNGMIRVLFSHEITEALMKFEGDEERLKNMYLSVRELNSDVSGIKNYILFLLKTDEHSTKIRNTLYFHALSLIRYYKKYHGQKNAIQHYRGYLFTLNYLLEKGAMKVTSENKVDVDVKSMLSCISDISNSTIDLLINGTEEAAAAFFKPYLDEGKIKHLLNL